MHAVAIDSLSVCLINCISLVHVYLISKCYIVHVYTEEVQYTSCDVTINCIPFFIYVEFYIDT